MALDSALGEREEEYERTMKHLVWQVLSTRGASPKCRGVIVVVESTRRPGHGELDGSQRHGRLNDNQIIQTLDSVVLPPSPSCLDVSSSSLLFPYLTHSPFTFSYNHYILDHSADNSNPHRMSHCLFSPPGYTLATLCCHSLGVTYPAVVGVW